MAQNEIKFVNEANLRRYTKKVKAAVDAASRTVQSEATTSSTTGEYPLHLNHAAYSASNPAATATTDKVFVDNNLRYNPVTHELKITDGTNTATFSPTGGDAGDFTGTTTVEITDGTASAAPKVKVKVGSSDEATSGEITKATTSVYGVTKLADSTGTSTTLAATQNLATNAGKTVNQSAASGSTPINVVVSNVSGVGEVKTASDISYTPSTRTTTIHTNGKTSGTSTSFSFHNGTLNIGDASIDDTAYSGRATGTETKLAEDDADNGGAAAGAYSIGYYDMDKEQATTVADALNEIIGAIGGGGSESSLTARVTALETGKADKTAAVGSITGTTGGNETGNYTTVSGTAKTFKYNNDKVAQESDSANTNYPLLFGNATTPTTGATKYNGGLKYNPSLGKITVGSTVTTSGKTVEITNTGITFATTEVGGTSVSINASSYGGTAAQATADGSGNNIVNTYATKAALEALESRFTGSFQIVSTLPTADGTHGGIIYLIKDTEHGDASSNIFIEYIEVKDGSTWKFESLGTTDAGVDVVSLTDAEIDSIWANPDAA